MVQKRLLKLLRVLVHDPVCVRPKLLHFAEVAPRRLVALETILVAALLLAQLAVPAELLKALGLDAIGYLRGQQRGQGEDEMLAARGSC